MPEEKKIPIQIITEREQRLTELRAKRAELPAAEKNRECDLAAGDTQCVAKVKLAPEVVKFCSMIDGHGNDNHVTMGGVVFSTLS